MTHSEAIYSLAATFDTQEWLIYTECGVGPKFDGLPDLMLVRKSYARPEIRVYEIKVTDSDFTQDARSGKFMKYMEYADKLYFALGPDIKTNWKEKLSGQQVGVMSLRGDKWVNHRPAPKLTHEKRIDWHFFLALMMNGKVLNKTDRLTRLEAYRTELLAIENGEKTYTVNNALQKKMTALKDKERQFEDMVKQAEIEATTRLRKRLGLDKGWYSSEIIEDLYDASIQSALYAANRAMKDKLKLLFPEEEKHD